MTVDDKNLKGSVAFEITSFLYFFCQVCDSLLNIGPSTCVDMGEPAFLSVSAAFQDIILKAREISLLYTSPFCIDIVSHSMFTEH